MGIDNIFARGKMILFGFVLSVVSLIFAIAGMSIVSVGSSILLLGCLVIFSILGLVLSNVGLVRQRNRDPFLTLIGVLGIILSAVAIILLFFLAVSALVMGAVFDFEAREIASQLA